MTHETTPAAAAPSQPGSADPTRPGADGQSRATLTRAQWRRIAAEAELAAKVAASQTSTALIEIVDTAVAPADSAAETSRTARIVTPVETPLATEVADALIDADFDETAQAAAPRPVSAARTDDDIVLTVVDGDAHAGIEFFDAADAEPVAARRRHVADDVTAHLPGESFGPAAVDDEALPGADGLPAAEDIPMPAPLPDDRVVDEFEFASRLFSFTAQTPVQVAAEAIAEQESVDTADASPGRTSRIARRMAAASVSVSAMAAAGLLAVGLNGPAAAVFASGDAGREISADISATSSTGTDTAADEEQIQAYVSSSQQDVTFDRNETFDVTSVTEIAADSGVTIFAGTWVNDPNAAIQWPFPVGVPISAAFGSSTYLSQFSTPHRGVDLTPGEGADIHAVAAGTVRIATESGGDYGVTVVIDHEINGELVSTRYGHMQYESLEVEVGDTVQPGQIIGKVGSTGRSTGAHLHLEVLLGGTTHTDPIAWLEEHTAS